MKFGLNQQEFDLLKSVLADPLKELGAQVWVFGSRARGDYKKFSDLDLLISSDKDLFSELGNIEDKIIESNFPYKVDMVQEQNLADSYRESVEKDKVLFI